MKSLLLSIALLSIMSCATDRQADAIIDADQKTETESKLDGTQNKDGAYLEIYPSGATRIEGMYRKGLKEGNWTSYYANGVKWSEEHFVNDKRSGPTKAYYPSGTIRFTGYYQQDMEKGKWYFFSEEGVEEKVVDMDEK